MGVNTYLNSIAANSNYILAMGGQSNCSGPGVGADFQAKYQAVIPGTKIYYNGSMQNLQLGVNNKNSPNGNGGYELTLSYNLNAATGKNIYIAKRDQGGTQIANDTGTTSSTSMTIGTGAKTPTIGTGLSYEQNNILVFEEVGGTARMEGLLASYNSGTGATQVNFTSTTGSGTFSNWTVKLKTWNSAVRNQYCDEWLTSIYRTIDYCEANSIQYKIILFWIHGEEDGLNTTKANAYLANMRTFRKYVIVKIHEYIQSNYPGRVIPHIKFLIAECGSNSGSNGDTIRSSENTLAEEDPHTEIISSSGIVYNADEVHISSGGFEYKGEGEAKTKVLALWT